MRLKLSLLLIGFVMSLLPGLAQVRITGKVMSKSNNTPLSGVNIIVKSTGLGTITNTNGNFGLAVKEEDVNNLELIFSFIGLETQVIQVNNREYLEVYMEEAVNELQQVVITSSYGTKKLKEEVVGSIETIQSKDIQVDQAFESVDKMLEGQIAGVNIETGSGVLEPVKIHIRGQGSLSPTSNAVLGTSTQPLIIIDGVIMSEEAGIDSDFFDGSGTFSENYTNPIAQIAPEDIESINVLKDAAAVSIYGADGSNGVIIITTKKGKAGPLKVNLSAQSGISQAINRIKYMNGEQYNALRNEYLINTGQQSVAYNGVDTDWYGLLNENGSFNKISLSASGGKNKFNFRVGLNYLGIDEAQVGNSSKQYRASTSLGYSGDRLKVDLSVNPSYISKTAPNTYYAYAFVPTLSPFNEDETYADVGVLGMGNPLAGIAQNLNETKTKGVITSININFDLTDNWSAFTAAGVDYKDKEQDRYFSGANESGQYNGTFTLDGVKYNKWGRRLINLRQSTRWNWQAQTMYQKNITDNHYFDIMGGIELAEEKADLEYHSGVGFVNPDIINPVSAAIKDDDPKTLDDDRYKNQTHRYEINNNSRVSFFSQLNYDFKKKYFLLVNFRRDESSVFGDETNVAYNGGTGLSWIISKEHFLRNSNWLDFLRLRISYGTTGNSRIGSYSSKGIYTFSSSGGYLGVSYAYPSDAPNPNLSWETNKKFNVGLDINLMTRLNLTVEYFYDDIHDMISSRDVPDATGYSSVQLNSINMYNKGLEASLNTTLIKTNDINWTTSFNISTLKNKILSVTGFGDTYSLSARATAIKVGSSTSTIWGVRWAGIDPATGRDLVNKDGQIYEASLYDELFDATDWEPIGNTQPNVYGGFNSKFTYKNFNFSVRGSYKLGANKLVDKNLISNYNITSNRNLSVNAIDYWQQPGDMALLPAVTSYSPLISNLDKFIYDTSHIKISNISLSYNFKFSNPKFFIKDIRLMADISNVWYWYKHESPEDRNGIREFMYTYPESRTYTLGLKMNF